MILDVPFMAWIDHLHEVGEPIRKDRSRLLDLAEQAAELERHALALRAQVAAGQAELLAKVQRSWSAEEIARARARDCDRERAGRDGFDLASLSGPEGERLRRALNGLDGTHLAVQALQAFRDGLMPETQGLTGIAIEANAAEGYREALMQVLAWWHLAGAPVLARLKRSPPRGW